MLLLFTINKSYLILFTFWEHTYEVELELIHLLFVKSLWNDKRSLGQKPQSWTNFQIDSKNVFLNRFCNYF